MIDKNGRLQVALPPQEPKSLARSLARSVALYVVLPMIASVFIGYKLLTDKSFRSTMSSLYSLVSGATSHSIIDQWYYQDRHLLLKLWTLPSAKVYIDEYSGAPLLEYQTLEGYCGSATQQCVLRSFGVRNLPKQRRGESKPDIWCEHIASLARESSASGNNGTTEGERLELKTKVVSGSVSYCEFLTTLRAGLANPNCRVACNYLRSGLTGFESSGLARYFPTTLLMKIFAGHFSPILGIVEQDGDTCQHESMLASSSLCGSEEKKSDEDEAMDNPLVAIFDTNAKYGGTYFVPARRLYESVHAVDVGSNKNRAIILIEK